MKLRRMLGLIPWMLRLSFGGSAWPLLVLVALYWVPFVALRIWSPSFVELHYTLLPAFLAVMVMRKGRQPHWPMLSTLPVLHTELILSSLIADVAALAFLASSMPFRPLTFLITWIAVLVVGWTKNIHLGALAAAVFSVLGGLIAWSEMKAPPDLVYTLILAIVTAAVTAAEFWKHPSGAARPTGSTNEIAVVGGEGILSIRLPVRALMRSYPGLWLSNDFQLSMFCLLYPVLIVAHTRTGRTSGEENLVLMSGMIALALGSKLAGTTAEFFAVRPLSLKRRASFVVVLTLICSFVPGLARLATWPSYRWSEAWTMTLRLFAVFCMGILIGLAVLGDPKRATKIPGFYIACAVGGIGIASPAIDALWGANFPMRGFAMLLAFPLVCVGMLVFLRKQGFAFR